MQSLHGMPELGLEKQSELQIIKSLASGENIADELEVLYRFDSVFTQRLGHKNVCWLFLIRCVAG